MLEDTVQEAALRVSALATVLLVGTPQARVLQVQQRPTALHAPWDYTSTYPVALMLVIAARATQADTEDWPVVPASAWLHVRLDGSPLLQQQLGQRLLIVLAVLQVPTCPLLALQQKMAALNVPLVPTLM